MNTIRAALFEYGEAMNYHLLPIYVGLVVVTGWLGVLSIFVLDIENASAAEAMELAKWTKALMYTFLVIPFIRPAIAVVTKRWLA